MEIFTVTSIILMLLMAVGCTVLAVVRSLKVDEYLSKVETRLDELDNAANELKEVTELLKNSNEDLLSELKKNN